MLSVLDSVGHRCLSKVPSFAVEPREEPWVTGEGMSVAVFQENPLQSQALAPPDRGHTPKMGWASGTSCRSRAWTFLQSCDMLVADGEHT